MADEERDDTIWEIRVMIGGINGRCVDLLNANSWWQANDIIEMLGYDEIETIGTRIYLDGGDE